jgi:hypothetical protein
MRGLLDPPVQNPVREQFRILTHNIKALIEVRKEVGLGLVGRTVEREVTAQIAALSELRERFFNGVVSGNHVEPLEVAPSKIEVLDIADYPQAIPTIPEQIDTMLTLS